VTAPFHHAPGQVLHLCAWTRNEKARREYFKRGKRGLRRVERGSKRGATWLKRGGGQRGGGKVLRWWQKGGKDTKRGL